MRFTATQKVIATSAAALGIVLGAAGITAAATDSGTTPAQQPTSTDEGTGNFTPANEQGKAEPADTGTEANDPAEANDKADANEPAGSDKADGPEAADPSGTDQPDATDTPAATTTAPAAHA
jgi:hypothetical protein